MSDPEKAALLVAQLLPLFILSFLAGIVCCRLAIEKRKNVALWTIFGFIPIIGLFCVLPYMVGAVDLGLHAKLDQLIAQKGTAVKD
jgi:hypothetical protein